MNMIVSVYAVANLFYDHCDSNLNYLCGAPASRPTPLVAEVRDVDTRLGDGLMPGDFILGPSDDQLMLFSQFYVGDQEWLPRKRYVPGVGLQYTYQRSDDSSPLTIDQIRALIRNPPRFLHESQMIRLLMQRLRRLGVKIVLGMPQTRGAAAEWNHAFGLLRIRPDIPRRGTLAFARILNHESIHVAQSCRSGSMRAKPVRLGWPIRMNSSIQRYVAQPVYAGLAKDRLLLEVEAYAYQNQLSSGLGALKIFCDSLNAHPSGFSQKLNS